jgi:uncharacterized membrane protein YkvA (DUF1232 family)
MDMEPSQRRTEASTPNSDTLADILAVIESAKVRGGMEALERFIAKALPEAEESEVREAAEVALEVIESVPIFLARARQEANTRDLVSVIIPLLEHAEMYYLQPMDVLPEMTLGLPGLLDDSYLVIRILQHIEKGPEPFLDWDLEYPARFLRRLTGPAVPQQLDKLAIRSMEDVSTHLQELWEKMEHRA